MNRSFFKPATIFSCCLFLCATAEAQRDSLKDEILKKSVTTGELITRGRKLVEEKIIAGDKKKAKELVNYLITYEDKGHVVLFPIEKWLFYYLTAQYDSILNNASSFEKFISSPGEKFRPPPDSLTAVLHHRALEEFHVMNMDIQIADLGDRAKDFLTLNLEYLVAGTDESSQLSINQSCDTFLKKYPGSEFEPYIRKYVRFVMKTSKWGFAFEFFTGGGVFTGQLADHFTNNIPMGIAFDIGYKRFNLFLRNYIGFGLTRDSIHFNSVVWQRDEKAQMFLPEASLGYVVYENNKLLITPFVGITSMSIGPPSDDEQQKPEYKQVGLDYTTNYNLGVNLDLKLAPSGIPIIAREEKSYWFLRIRYAFNMPQFDKHYDGFSGNFHYLTIGIGGFGRRLKRDY